MQDNQSIDIHYLDLVIFFYLSVSKVEIYGLTQRFVVISLYIFRNSFDSGFIDLKIKQQAVVISKDLSAHIYVASSFLLTMNIIKF